MAVLFLLLVHQVASVGANKYAYFVFTTGGIIGDITVSTSNPALVLYAVNNYDSEDPNTLPTAANFTWSSLSNENSQNILVIPARDQTDAPYYTIGVFSAAAVSFTITATTAEAIIVRPRERGGGVVWLTDIENCC